MTCAWVRFNGRGGRISDVISVGGLKFMASEVELMALKFNGVELAKVVGKTNPITGQHAELTVQSAVNIKIDKDKLSLLQSFQVQ